jgi:hypothetical protein
MASRRRMVRIDIGIANRLRGSPAHDAILHGAGPWI